MDIVMGNGNPTIGPIAGWNHCRTSKASDRQACV
jgi:hypothetical protein